jgi:polyisoprenoid-binding protein YceI
MTLFAVAFAFASIAQASQWEFDKPHTYIGFKVKHLAISKVTGSFESFDGSVTYDEDDIANFSVTVTIDAASVNTANEKRDGHLKSADFFDVETYPNLKFVSKKIKKSADGLKIVGDLTIRDVTREVVLDVEDLTRPMEIPGMGTRMGATASTKVDRTDFGLNWKMGEQPLGMVVSKEVTIIIEVELVKKQ